VPSAQGAIETALHQMLTGAGNRVDAGIQRLGDLAVAPGVTTSEASAFSRMRASTPGGPGICPFGGPFSRSRSSALSLTIYEAERRAAALAVAEGEGLRPRIGRDDLSEALRRDLRAGRFR
jgi:hypothetical protein